MRDFQRRVERLEVKLLCRCGDVEGRASFCVVFDNQQMPPLEACPIHGEVKRFAVRINLIEPADSIDGARRPEDLS